MISVQWVWVVQAAHEDHSQRLVEAVQWPVWQRPLDQAKTLWTDHGDRWGGWGSPYGHGGWALRWESGGKCGRGVYWNPP
jgi:hypothetical protein